MEKMDGETTELLVMQKRMDEKPPVLVYIYISYINTHFFHLFSVIIGCDNQISFYRWCVDDSIIIYTGSDTGKN